MTKFLISFPGEAMVFPEEVFDAVWRFWPWALVLAGVVLVVQGIRRRA